LMPRWFFWTCERLELVSESKLVVLSSVLENTVHNWNDDFWQNTNTWRSSLGFFRPQFSSKSTATFLTLRCDHSDKSGPFFTVLFATYFLWTLPTDTQSFMEKIRWSFNSFYFRFCRIDMKPIRWCFVWLLNQSMRRVLMHVHVECELYQHPWMQ
jgi:hypothetical protein